MYKGKFPAWAFFLWVLIIFVPCILPLPNIGNSRFDMIMSDTTRVMVGKGKSVCSPAGGSRYWFPYV